MSELEKLAEQHRESAKKWMEGTIHHFSEYPDIASKEFAVATLFMKAARVIDACAEQETRIMSELSRATQDAVVDMRDNNLLPY